MKFCGVEGLFLFPSGFQSKSNEFTSLVSPPTWSTVCVCVGGEEKEKEEGKESVALCRGVVLDSTRAGRRKIELNATRGGEEL